MPPFRFIAGVLLLLSPSLGFAQATVPESALTGPAFSLKPGAAQPNQNGLGPSGIQPAPGLRGPHVAPGTPGALIPKLPMSEARAADPVLQAYVRSLQQQLPAHGYRPGPITGRLDPQTEQAIRAYQQDAGIQPNARSSWVLKQTLDSVSFAQPPIRAAAARPGNSVAFAQQRLAAKGYDPGPADGKLGRRTVTAIKDFQGDRGLARDGKLSPRVLDLLGRS
ncbi:MAG: penicillin-resistant DD-carboxypeptidase [Rhodospirillales bacterium]|nr:penicillin-resistant DD-carboxypeptidase [Rhodospirillales bacterium]